MKNGGKNKSVALIILFSVDYYRPLVVNRRKVGIRFISTSIFQFTPVNTHDNYSCRSVIYILVMLCFI